MIKEKITTKRLEIVGDDGQSCTISGAKDGISFLMHSPVGGSLLMTMGKDRGPTLVFQDSKDRIRMHIGLAADGATGIALFDKKGRLRGMAALHPKTGALTARKFGIDIRNSKDFKP